MTLAEGSARRDEDGAAAAFFILVNTRAEASQFI